MDVLKHFVFTLSSILLIASPGTPIFVDHLFGAGHEFLPDVALAIGGPRGVRSIESGFHVVSLGVQGELVLGFQPGQAITDGDGDDLIVFENAMKSLPGLYSGSAAVADSPVRPQRSRWKKRRVP